MPEMRIQKFSFDGVDILQITLILKLRTHVAKLCRKTSKTFLTVKIH